MRNGDWFSLADDVSYRTTESVFVLVCIGSRTAFLDIQVVRTRILYMKCRPPTATRTSFGLMCKPSIPCARATIFFLGGGLTQLSSRHVLTHGYLDTAVRASNYVCHLTAAPIPRNEQDDAIIGGRKGYWKQVWAEGIIRPCRVLVSIKLQE